MKKGQTIKIIGAGPAGLTAAIFLARNNYDVAVYEKNSDVGMRFNNDFQGLENWSSEEDVLKDLETMSIRADWFYKPFHKGLLVGPSVKADIESKHPIFYLVRRGTGAGTLDSALKKQASDLGVKIFFNTVADIKDGDIIATGPQKPVMFATGIVFETDIADTASVVLDNNVAPKGYAYLLSSDGHATLATVLFEDFKRCNHYLDKTVLKFKDVLSFAIRNPKQFTGFGNFFIRNSAIREDKFFVGEAAGFQDFLFGFGIRYAVTSGYLAAKSIAEGTNYNKLWKMRFQKQLKASYNNRKIYELFGSAAYDTLIKKTVASRDPRKLWLTFYNMSVRTSLNAIRLLLRKEQTG